jgi:hypothetical protein
MTIDIGPEFDFLNLNNFLLFAGFRGTFLCLKFIFPIIQNFTDWRLGIRLNLDKIHAEFGSFPQSIISGENAHLVSFGVNAPDR